MADRLADGGAGRITPELTTEKGEFLVTELCRWEKLDMALRSTRLVKFEDSLRPCQMLDKHMSANYIFLLIKYDDGERREEE